MEPCARLRAARRNAGQRRRIARVPDCVPNRIKRFGTPSGLQTDLPMTGSSARYRLGVDVGGTHTDLVLLDPATGVLLVEKVSSTPENPALGVLNGVARFVARGIAPGAIEFFAHGTTITTNALLEMRGAKVGLLITKGFR